MTRIFIGVMVWALALAAAEAGPERWAYEVVESYPHDRSAFTQGLYYDGASLVLGTGQYGWSSIRIVDLSSGKTAKRVNLDRRLFGEGVARHGDLLYQLTWKAGLAFAYDPETLERKRVFRYRGEGWGITSDGAALITSDGSEVLTWRDPESFVPRRAVRVTREGRAVTSLNELEFIKGQVYANVWQRNEIVVIDPASGVVEAAIDCTSVVADQLRRNRRAGVLNGIAYDRKRDLVLVTGKNWTRIYALRVRRAE